MRSKRRLISLVLVVSVGAAGAAAADEKKRQDRTARSTSSYDIARISHRHEVRPGALRHTVTFDGQPDLPGQITFVFVYYKDDRRLVKRKVLVRESPDGSLYGELRDDKGKLIAIVPAGMEDPSTLFIQVPVRRLDQPRPFWYVWAVRSILGPAGADGRCKEEKLGQPACRDRAPESGWLLHQLVVPTFI